MRRSALHCVPVVSTDGTDTVEISVEDLLTVGEAQLYAKATRNSGADTIYTNLRPITVEPLTFVLAGTNASYLSKDGGDQITLFGDFTQNNGTLDVVFTPDGGTPVSGSNISTGLATKASLNDKEYWESRWRWPSVSPSDGFVISFVPIAAPYTWPIHYYDFPN